MHSNIYIQGTAISEKLPARDLCHLEEKGSSKYQQGHSPSWHVDPGEEELSWSVHHCPGGWSVPVPPTRHLDHKTQRIIIQNT